MAWSERKELTEGQKAAAEIAGIPDSREGLWAEYPKAVYREGKGPQLLGEPFKVNGMLVDTATVANAEEEAEALAEGWFLTIDLKEEQKRRDALAEKDEEIARLQAQLASGEPRRGPGRPPKSEISSSANLSPTLAE